MRTVQPIIIDRKMMAAGEKAEDYTPASPPPSPPRQLHTHNNIVNGIFDMTQVELDSLRQSRNAKYLTKTDIKKAIDNAIKGLRIPKNNITKKQRGLLLRNLGKAYLSPTVSDAERALNQAILDILNRGHISQREIDEITKTRGSIRRKIGCLYALEHTRIYASFYEAEGID